MSPLNIVKAAIAKKLDLISVTDHNSTRQSAIMAKTAEDFGIAYIYGVEVATKEEIHLLCYFEDFREVSKFQIFLDENMLKIKNKPEKFGYQVVVDEDENIVYEEENLLISAIDLSIDEIIEKVRSLAGVIVPAHIDKGKFSLISQLGFIPLELDYDALEITKRANRSELQKKFFIGDEKPFLRRSHAHYLADIGSSYSILNLDKLDFKSFKYALQNNQVEG